MSSPDDTQRRLATGIVAELEAEGYENAQPVGRGGFGVVYHPNPMDAKEISERYLALVPRLAPMIDDTVTVNIGPGDVRVDTFRSSGAGGSADT